MSDLLAARSQMGASLIFHIVFAVVGIGMPVLMVVSEWRHVRTGDPIYLDLAKRWSKGTAIMFAVGAVSGTILSFELGLLWPRFMALAGPIIGMPLSLEGFAFFLEAIFLGVYLYGWNRISTRAHLVAGVLVAVSGAASAVFIVIANAWMNSPAGIEVVNGEITRIDPLAAMANPGAFSQTLHMVLAAYAATGLGVAGIHAFLLLRDPSNAFHRRALTVALLVGCPAAIAQPFAGDFSARYVADNQPVKLAAMESVFETEAAAPLLIGGWPDMETATTRYAIKIPYGLSILSYGDPKAVVKGLDQVARADWPHVPTVHVSFQVMVALGTYMALLSLYIAYLAWRRRDLASNRRLLQAIALGAPMGFLAIEAGWIVTEVGRQPWIINGVQRTSEAVTPMPGLIVPFLFFTLLYIALSIAVVWLMRRQILQSPSIPDQRGLRLAEGEAHA